MSPPYLAQLLLKLLVPTRITLVLCTASAVRWKKQLTTSRGKSYISNVEVYRICKTEANWPIANNWSLPEEDSPCVVRLATLATVIFLSRTWSPGKNTIVVLEIKYMSALCAYSESVAQWVLWGQDEHEVAVGVTQCTLPAEKYERLVC